MTTEQLCTVYELYVRNGRRYGFRIVSWRPRHYYALVKDFGGYKTVDGEKRWFSLDPDLTTESEARRRQFVYLVDLYWLADGSFAKPNHHVQDGRSWLPY